MGPGRLKLLEFTALSDLYNISLSVDKKALLEFSKMLGYDGGVSSRICGSF